MKLGKPFMIQTNYKSMHVYHALIALGAEPFEANASDGCFIYHPRSNSFTSLPVDAVSHEYTSNELTLDGILLRMSEEQLAAYRSSIKHLVN